MRQAGSSHTLIIVEGGDHTSYLVNYFEDSTVWSVFDQHLKGGR